MQTNELAPTKESTNGDGIVLLGVPNEQQPVAANTWQQFMWRHSPHHELALSSAASWAMHGLVLLAAWGLAIWLIRQNVEPPALDVVALGDGSAGGPAGGGDGLPKGGDGENTAAASELTQDLSAFGEKVEMKSLDLQLPDLPTPDTTKTRLVPASSKDNATQQLDETAAALNTAGELLRKTLEANQSRGRGVGSGGGAGGAGGTGGGVGGGQGGAAGPGAGGGRGKLDANSTAGRQARWVITYPTLPRNEYEQMLDHFRIELAYLMADRKTMQYLSSFGGAGKKRTGEAADEDRMFWYWDGQNRLRDLDDDLMTKHGVAPPRGASPVVHIYPSELEKKLADMERDFLRKQYKTADVERILQTNFRIAPGRGSGWQMEVTGITLR